MGCNIMEQTAKLFEFLDEGMRYINSWTPTEINDGGCGIFALLLYDHLQQIGVKQQIVAYIRKDKNWRDYVESNLLKYINNEGEAIHAGALHVIIKAEIDGSNVYIDADGINSSRLMRLVNNQCGIDITREQLQELWDKSDMWNYIFDREQVPFISDKMNYVFNHINDFSSDFFEFPKQDIELSERTVVGKLKKENEYWGMY